MSGERSDEGVLRTRVERRRARARRYYRRHANKINARRRALYAQESRVGKEHPVKGVVWSSEQVNEIVGDDLFRMFDTWAKREWPWGGEPEQTVRAFAVWMVSTPEGSDALARIQEFPRQLSLKFPDDMRPWTPIRGCDGSGKEHIVYVCGTAISLVCPTCEQQ